MSAKGHIKDGCSYKTIAKRMKEVSFNCLINLLDSIAVLFTFQSKEEIPDMIKEDQLKSWFADIVPWRESSMVRETSVWVLLEEVLLQVWHTIFFESLGIVGAISYV